jgi:N-acetyl-anhydromuramyl-L-alanine amidase AmpD
VQGSFLQFFDQYGLDICGYPISEQIEESGLPSQYFQRLGLEEFKPGKIRLKPVGSEAWASREKIAQLELQVQKLRERSLAGGGPTKPDVTDVVDKLPKHASKQFPSRWLADIEQIVIHHTATGPTITPQRMAQYQVQTLDKAGITYHFFIATDGTVYQTSRLETLTDHARDQSASSVGVVFAGDFSDDIPAAAQLQAGGQLCAWLLDHLRLSSDRVAGLSEFASTESPGIQWLRGKRWKDKLLAKVEAVLKKAGGDQPPMEPVATGLHAVSQPPIKDMVDELPKHETKTYSTRSRSEIKALVIHHSAVPARVGPKSIANYHVTRLDWPAIGYHLMVSAGGIIYQTNRLETVSTHTADVNPWGVGICFQGNFNEEVPPRAQLQAGAHLAAWLMQELGVTLDDVKGHREFMDTACPGDQWLRGQNWKQMLRQEIVKVRGGKTKPSPAQAPGAKPIHHYVLFWAYDGTWAEKDWESAQEYISTFRPTVGFSANDAVQAEYVTIIGGSLGVTKDVENWLKAQGCKTDRVTGEDEAGTVTILNNLVREGKRFQALDA